MSLVEYPVEEQLSIFIELMRSGDLARDGRPRAPSPAAHPDSHTETTVEGVGPGAPALDGDDDDSTGSSYPRCSDGNGTLTHLFFSDDEFDLARAKAICSKCGLATSCLDGALERVEPYGVWGGKLVVDGVIVEVKRGRGRPPKTPRPPVVVDEVPVPPHLVA